MVGLLQAFPGTRLYERMKQEGRICQESSGDNVNGSTNFHPAMDLDVLRDGYKRILQHIYSPEHYYRRIRTYLRNTRPPRAKSPLRFSDVHALFLSFWRLGVVGQERFQYWHLLLWILCRRPQLLDKAVTLAIYGYHFRKICDLHVA
jgi:hypothetical protein